MALTKITSTNIGANAVTSSALSNTALTTALGYTPANKAGDTFTGNVGVGGTASGLGGTVLHVEAAANYPELVLNRTSTGARKWGALVGNDSAFLIRDYTSGQNNIAVDTAGRVTMPYQPAFHAYPTGNPTFTADGGTSSPMTGSTFDTTEFNVGSHFSTSTSRFTAPIAGRYWFAFHLSCGTDPGTVQEAKLYINGVERRRAYYRAGTNITANESNVVTAILNLSAGDYVQCGVYTNNAFTLMGGQSGGQAHFTYFCGYLVG